MLVIGVVAACASTTAGVIMFLLGGVSLIIIPLGAMVPLLRALALLSLSNVYRI